MNQEDLFKKTKFSQLKVISIGVEYLNDCFELDEIALHGLWSKSQWEKELSDSRKVCLGIFFKSNLISLACGWIILRKLNITAIAVHPEQRGFGLGTKILKVLLRKAHVLGAKEATLEVKSTNYSANALYKKFGFEISGMRKNYYKDGSDALILSLNLNYD